VSGAVLSAGDRIRAIVQLGREAREVAALADAQYAKYGPGWDPIADAANQHWGFAVNGITDHLAALEATGVLEAIAEAADLFEGGRA
jgi:hypothetical protein